MDRCCYKHYFLTYDHHKNDGTEQCWLSGDDVANFGTKDKPIYHCMFHAPVAKKAIDKTELTTTALNPTSTTKNVTLCTVTCYRFDMFFSVLHLWDLLWDVH